MQVCDLSDGATGSDWGLQTWEVSKRKETQEAEHSVDIGDTVPRLQVGLEEGFDGGKKVLWYVSCSTRAIAFIGTHPGEASVA